MVRHVLLTLGVVVAGCTSGNSPSASPASSTTETITQSPPTTDPTTRPTTDPTTDPTTRPTTPSLQVWATPANPLELPHPTGPDAVGVAASGFPDTVVYYPAVAATGRGHRRYVDPRWASLAGLDPSQMDRVVPAAQVDGTAVYGTAPRPVVILNPGWRSIMAFSTSLAEDLASHGYVVLASQTDISTESGHAQTTVQDRATRVALLRHLLDFATGPLLPAIVGPVDVHRIAAGGHSYAGAIALDVGLIDARIAAVIDIDGGARAPAGRSAPRQTTLVIVTMDGGVVSDPTLATLVGRSPRIVSVGVDDALHMDVTDGGSIPSVLGTSVFSTLLGKAGRTGTTDANSIVLRFLGAAIGRTPRQPTSAELVRGLPSTNDDPFAGVR